jgi:RNA polymerase-binding transcription factor DksA
MNKKELQGIKEKLEEQKESFSKQLERFAEKDPKVKGDWDTAYPQFQSSNEAQAEEAADEVEEYVNLLPVEHSFETQLAKINKALEKIKDGTYGKCEKCGNDIEKERLEVYPEARWCAKCHKISIKP